MYVYLFILFIVVKPPIKRVCMHTFRFRKEDFNCIFTWSCNVSIILHSYKYMFRKLPAYHQGSKASGRTWHLGSLPPPPFQFWVFILLLFYLHRSRQTHRLIENTRPELSIEAWKYRLMACALVMYRLLVMKRMFSVHNSPSLWHSADVLS